MHIEEYTQEVIGSIVQNVSIFILSKEGVTEAEIQTVQTTLFLFVELYADLYSRKYFIECPSNSLSRALGTQNICMLIIVLFLNI